MNDNDLERDLRSQRGQREEGYTPAVLPMTPDGGHIPASGLSRLPRAAMFGGVAVAGALAVAVVAGIFSGSGPDVGSGSPSPSAGASTPAVVACGPGDVAVTAEPWGGAAGSVGTVVTIRLLDGRDPCAIDGRLAASIADANGNVLVSARTSSPSSASLDANTAFTVGVAWSNWCAGQLATPVTLSLRIDGWASGADVQVPGGPDRSLPCSGAGQPSSLSVTDLQPAQ
jgi:hypothetical protein